MIKDFSPESLARLTSEQLLAEFEDAIKAGVAATYTHRDVKTIVEADEKTKSLRPELLRRLEERNVQAAVLPQSRERTKGWGGS